MNGSMCGGSRVMGLLERSLSRLSLNPFSNCAGSQFCRIGSFVWRVDYVY